MKTEKNEILKNRFFDSLVAILLLGSLWGLLSEIILTCAVLSQGLPFKGGMAGYITAIGIGMMGIAFGKFKKPSLLMGIPLVTILSKLLALSIFNIPIVARANSSLAILVGGIALTATVTLAGNNLFRNNLLRLASGMSAGFMAAIAFFFIGMRIIPCPYLLSFNRAGGFRAFMSFDGIVWTVFSGLLFYTGYWLGTQLKNASSDLRSAQSLACSSGSAWVAICCLVAMVFLITSGS